MRRGALRLLLQLLLLCCAAAFSAGVAYRRGGAARAPIAMQEERRFEVCQGRYCSKKGAKRTLALFEELGADVPGVLVEVADMGHTDHGCFDECTMGRESRIFLNHSLLHSSADRPVPSFASLLPQPMCASAAKGLARTAGRSSTASRARPRWRSCLESTHQPRRDGAPGPWRELHCRPPAGATARPIAPRPLHLPYTSYPRPATVLPDSSTPDPLRHRRQRGPHTHSYARKACL